MGTIQANDQVYILKHPTSSQMMGILVPIEYFYDSNN